MSMDDIKIPQNKNELVQSTMHKVSMLRVLLS
jgi:hypothetical protein